MLIGGGVKKVTLPEDRIIKILHVSSNGPGFSYPAYFYTGNPSSGNLDMILPSGNSNSTFSVASDAPVFVNTVVTDLDYELCKNWSVAQWEFCHDTIGDKYLYLNTTQTQKKYIVPMSEITSGQCYVVIAHFANGDSDMSDVMVKP